jgi:hypothetical protein
VVVGMEPWKDGWFRRSTPPGLLFGLIFGLWAWISPPRFCSGVFFVDIWVVVFFSFVIFSAAQPDNGWPTNSCNGSTYTKRIHDSRRVMFYRAG